MSREESARLFERAKALIPGGVNSPVRAFGPVGGDPVFFRRAEGARMWDADGREYLDYVGSWGPMILGHNHPDVRGALEVALRDGTSFGAPSPGEVELARLVVEMVPSVEVVRLVNSGTEATMSALRLARAATERPGMIKFRGGYHGHGDAFLVEAGSGAATLGVPSSPGVTEGAAKDTLVAEYNDLDSVRSLLEQNRDRVAAVFVEPVAGNMGCVGPEPGFLEGLRSLCDEHGALLIFDEVMTGFRLAAGGAQERFGVAPDRPVYQAGTLSGNPLAVAAGIATLTRLREHPEVFDELERLGARLEAGMTGVVEEGGYPLSWNRVGAMATLFFTPDRVTGWETSSGQDKERFGAWFHGMLERGIYLPPSPFEALFLSAAHSDEDIDRTVDEAREVLGEVFA